MAHVGLGRFGESRHHRSGASARSRDSQPRKCRRALSLPRSSIVPRRFSADQSSSGMPIPTQWASFRAWIRNPSRFRRAHHRSQPLPLFQRPSGRNPHSHLRPAPHLVRRRDVVLEVEAPQHLPREPGSGLGAIVGSVPAATTLRPGCRQPASRSLVEIGHGAAESVAFRRRAGWFAMSHHPRPGRSMTSLPRALSPVPRLLCLSHGFFSVRSNPAIESPPSGAIGTG